LRFALKTHAVFRSPHFSRMARIAQLRHFLFGKWLRQY
jgi:hypothetical protein